ncbi:MAG TPA: histidinol-phosphatase HisJ family protein [Tenuifilaceae bacterium]|mgnify:FL=1|nr:histidinol-phosphatase HisJ family protein [Tenuifilaceae bacterium]
MKIDYHMHTYLSDGRDTHEQMIASASYRGIEEMGFSDHVSIKPARWAIPIENIDEMVRRVQTAQAENAHGLIIKFGVEMDYIPGMEKQIQELIAKLPVDYVIGSVHFMDDWNFDTDVIEYDNIDINRFYRQYFKLVQQSAASKLFDIIGHCDLAKKFAYYPSFSLNDLYEKTAQIFKKANVAVELNTSGRIKPCNEFYPSVPFLERLAYYKVPITLGSDAHIEQNVGQFFDDALTMLKALGFKEIARFTKRQREMVKI